MTFGDAVHTYSLLTIGDGLVSQIPALLLSVATGIIVTRSASDGDIGSDVFTQLTRRRTAAAARRRCRGGDDADPGHAEAAVPGRRRRDLLPLPRATPATGRRRAAALAAASEAPALEAAAPHPDSLEALAEEIRVDPLELELSADLIDLVDTTAGGDLLDRVKALRRKVAADLGVIVPPVRTRDNLDLPLRTYAIKLFGIEVARGEAPPGTVLAIGDGLEGIPGQRTEEPVFGLAAVWVPVELRSQAELAGATVVDRSSVVTTHLAEIVRSHASRLAQPRGRARAGRVGQALAPAVVDELTPAQLSLGEVQRVLQALLEEHVSVRDLVRIFEALSMRARVGKDLDGLVEAVRQVLGPAVVAPYAATGTLPVLCFEPALEQRLLEGLRAGEDGAFLALDADLAQTVLTSLATTARARRRSRACPRCWPARPSCARRYVGCPHRPCRGCRSCPTPSWAGRSDRLGRRGLRRRPAPWWAPA